MTYDGRIMAAIVVPAGVTLSATSNAGGPTSVPITAGTYASIVAFAAHVQAQLIATRPVTAGTWTVTVSTGASGTGKVTIAVTNGTYSITWTSTDLRDVLGFTANIAAQVTSTGAQQARGLWMPDCPLLVDGTHLAAPRVTDLNETESPSGFVIGHVGNQKFRQRNLVYTHSPKNRVFLASESTVNESLERFLLDTQWGLGHAWFTPKSKCVVIAHDGNQLGNGTVAGWYLKGGRATDELVRRRADSWDGMWTVTFPELVSDS